MPAAKTDYYQTLGVPRTAGEDEIRKAYRRLARKYHPDLNPGDKAAEERFKAVQEAYDVLSDKRKRQLFDQFGFYSDNMSAGGPGAGPGGGAQAPPGFDFSGFDFGEAFPGAGGAGGAGGGSFRDLFSQFFGGQAGGGRGRQSQPEKGADLEYAVNIDFWQSIRGTQSKLNITRHEACPDCQGSGSGSGAAACPQCNGAGQVTQSAGAMRFNLTCPRCQGRGRLVNACTKCFGDGRVSRPDTVEVRIPPGATNGSRLRVAGKGNAGTMGAPPGDLYITLRVEPHPFFKREGDNIEVKIPVAVWEAALGAKIEVPTIEGKALLKVPQGTKSGQRFRMADKGVFNARKNTRGHQIVEIEIQAPDITDDRVRKLMRELSDLPHDDPRAGLWSQAG